MAISTEFDPGPPANVAQHLANMPSYEPHRDLFWYDWGPVFYRGRLNGAAKVMGVASDPGPAEQVACRTLVGDAGQRVQGFLTKLGLVRNYVLVNAHPFALHPGHFDEGMDLLDNVQLKNWRNTFYDLITDSTLEAIIAFGAQAQKAVDLWTNKPSGVTVVKIPHPSNPGSATALAAKYAAAITQLRGVVTPDSGGSTTGPDYGAQIVEADYAPIPRRDLGFGVPPSLGDDKWARTAVPRQSNGVKRSGDLSLTWRIPVA